MFRGIGTWFGKDTFSGLLSQEVEQIGVFKTVPQNLVRVAVSYFHNGLSDCVESLLAGLSLSGRDDVHVNLTSSGVSGRLLQSMLDESDGLLNISFLDELAKSHLCKGLGKSDHTLQLPWSGSHSLSGIAETSQLHVLLHDFLSNSLRNGRFASLSSVRDVLGEELTINLVGLNELGGLHWSLGVRVEILL